MDAQTIIPPILLLIACFAYVFWPQPRLAAEVEKTRLDYLRERKEVIYDNLRDLNFEYLAGKYPESEYDEQRRALEDEHRLWIALDQRKRLIILCAARHRRLHIGRTARQGSRRESRQTLVLRSAGARQGGAPKEAGPRAGNHNMHTHVSVDPLPM